MSNKQTTARRIGLNRETTHIHIKPPAPGSSPSESGEALVDSSPLLSVGALAAGSPSLNLHCNDALPHLTPTIENVLPFYLSKSNSGQRVCLVTLFNVDDVSPRPVGSQIAVSEDGKSFGFITGGCAEAAIVHEALMALKENRSRRIRIGSDSSWFDIKLPCGAGIDLHFSVADSSSVIEQACKQLAARQPATLLICVADDGIELISSDQTSVESPHIFVKEYQPARRLVIIGSGPYLSSLESLARNAELQVSCWSPEIEESWCSNGPHGCLQEKSHHHLSRTTSLSAEYFDPWTAAVLLFHEHDWETRLLEGILSTDCFYIGALGSRKTHVARLNDLRKLGVAEADFKRIRGPVGLSIGAKTPAEIALSILSEIVAEYRGASMPLG